jgi:hypothetical protein
MMPSWKMSVQSGDSEPARMPPMSLKCAQLCVKAASRPSANTGATNTWSGECETAPLEA